MSFLDILPGVLHGALGQHLRPARIWREVPGGFVDAFGHAVNTVKDYAALGIIEGTREKLASYGVEAGVIEDRDIAALFLLHGLEIDPRTGDEFAIDDPRGKGERFRIVAIVSIDPARAHVVVHAAPTDMEASA